MPVELRYAGAPILLNPAVVGFQLDLDQMLAAYEQAPAHSPGWRDFWDYLEGHTADPVEIPLTATYSEARLQVYLEEIASIYDTPPSAAMPVAGSVDFTPGRAGSLLDVDKAAALVERALHSTTNRSVDLPVIHTKPPRPAFKNLEILLKQLIKLSGYDGLVGIYVLDLQTARELHFAYLLGQDIPVKPDIAFSASSIIKIPVMVTAFRRIENQPDEETLKLLGDMIFRSGNEAADWLMERVMDPNLGPILVSEDMQSLGLENTFLAGKFTAGSPLLVRYETPANQRPDVQTDPDSYNQTTPSEIGMLLADIYQCAQFDGGTFRAAFALPNTAEAELTETITQAECRMMIDLLVKNKLPSLLTAGLPDGTPIAHKHGWAGTGGVINTVGDAGIIFSPRGDYVLVIFLHQPVQVVWEPASLLIARLSQAVYNYYNIAQ